RAEVPAREQEDHRIATLEFTEPAARLGMVGQLVVGEDGSRDDVRTHTGLPQICVTRDGPGGPAGRSMPRRHAGSRADGPGDQLAARPCLDHHPELPMSQCGLPRTVATDGWTPRRICRGRCEVPRW